MKKRVCIIITLAALIACILCPYAGLAADSDDQRVFDYADILTSKEERGLANRVEVMQDRLQMDIVILTSDRINGKSWEAYADDFYDKYEFGYEQEHGTGIIFFISMDTANRGITITTSGHAIEWFTDDEIEWMYDDIIEYMYDADYFGGCDCFLNLAERYATNSTVAENGYYDENLNNWVEVKPTLGSKIKKAFSLGKVFLRTLISSAVALVTVLVMRGHTKTKDTVKNETYLHRGMNYTVRSDTHTGTTERKRLIQDNTSSRSSGGGGGFSSVHTSSGGFSHGGGGGRGF